MNREVIEPNQVKVNNFVTATYTNREGCAAMVRGPDRMLPNFVIEYNDEDCFRCILFAYVAIQYPAEMPVDYTVLSEQIGWAVLHDLECRNSTVQLPIDGALVKVVSNLGTPNLYSTSFRGLQMHRDNGRFGFVSVFQPKRLRELMGDELVPSAQIVKEEHLVCKVIDRHLLVTYTPPLEDAHTPIVTGYIEEVSNATVHHPSSEVAESEST